MFCYSWNIISLNSGKYTGLIEYNYKASGGLNMQMFQENLFTNNRENIFIHT